MVPRRVVAVLGRNAFVAQGGEATFEGELDFARRAIAHLAPFVERGVELVVSHGEGPRVGQVGLVVSQALHELLAERDIDRDVVTLFTFVEVDADDPALAAPTKRLGRFLDAREVEALRGADVVVADDGVRGPPSAVSSPRAVLDLDAVRALLSVGTIVVAAGGGVVPVMRDGAKLRAVDAALDEDLTAALLADAIDADLLVILTDVPCAYLDWGTSSPRPLHFLRAARARALLAQGAFSPKSMAAKIEAASRFVSRRARRAILCDPSGFSAALEERAGTIVVPDVIEPQRDVAALARTGST